MNFRLQSLSAKAYKGLHICKNSVVINPEPLKSHKVHPAFQPFVGKSPTCYADIFVLLLSSTLLPVFQGCLISLQWFLTVEGVENSSFNCILTEENLLQQYHLILSRAVLCSVFFCLKFLFSSTVAPESVVWEFSCLCHSGAHYPNSPPNERVIEIFIYTLNSHLGESKKMPQFRLLPYYSDKCSQYQEVFSSSFCGQEGVTEFHTGGEEIVLK